MKFNSVTWYSKLVALILFIALPFAGFYAGVKYQEAMTTPREIPIATDSAKQIGWATVVQNNRIIVKTKYESGKLKYIGTVQAPTACYKPKVETIVLESYPEQVELRVSVLTDKNIGSDICAQVITEKPIAGEIAVSENATVSVYLDGKKVD